MRPGRARRRRLARFVKQILLDVDDEPGARQLESAREAADRHQRGGRARLFRGAAFRAITTRTVTP